MANQTKCADLSTALSCLPCMNCASQVCCPPPQAFEATMDLLKEITGCDDETAKAGAERMLELGITFLPQSLANAIRDLVKHPDAE